MPRAELLIRSARLVDGSGSPARMADVAVDDDRIVAVETAGSVSTVATRRVIVADGLLLTPRWVDVRAHTHTTTRR